jgi:hypothetical protein
MSRATFEAPTILPAAFLIGETVSEISIGLPSLRMQPDALIGHVRFVAVDRRLDVGKSLDGGSRFENRRPKTSPSGKGPGPLQDRPRLRWAMRPMAMTHASCGARSKMPAIPRWFAIAIKALPEQSAEPVRPPSKIAGRVSS